MNKLKDLHNYIEENKQAGVNFCKKVFNINRLDNEDIFYTLVFCLLVPAGNARKTDQAIALLRRLDYENTDIDDISLYNYLRPYIRFPQQKTLRLISFKKSSKSFIKGLRNLVKEQTSSEDLRSYLVNRVRGMGYKASSHFLRDIGIKDLAIIDTHVLKYMSYFMPKNKQHYRHGSIKQYLEIESYFKVWAKDEFNLAPAYLDWFLWCKESGNPVILLEY